MVYINGKQIASIILPKVSDETIRDLMMQISRNNKRITNFEKALSAENIYEDSSVSHVKDVPVNAVPFTEIIKIGGMSHRDASAQTLTDTIVTEIESKSNDAVIDTLVIPVGVQNLYDYGQGVNAEHNNHIEFTEDGRVVFKKTVRKVELYGQENWNMNGDYFRIVFTDAPTYTNGGEAAYAVCDRYAETTSTSGGTIANGTFYCNSSYFGRGAFVFRDDSITDLAAWKAHLAINPITLVYSLSDEHVTETDISNLMTVDNFIKVEGGGNIVMVNTSNNAVPSTVIHRIKS